LNSSLKGDDVHETCKEKIEVRGTCEQTR